MKLQKFKRVLTISAISFLMVQMFYVAFEPGIVTAIDDTDVVAVNLTVTPGIAIDTPADVNMSALSTSQNTSVGSATWTVITNNYAGYSLTVFAGAAPAMVRSGGGGNIVDYTTVVAETPETWSVSNAAEFGFSGYGTDVIAGYGTDIDCLDGATVPSATLNWKDFDETGSADTLATASAATTTDGTATTMCVGVEQQGTVFANSGSYTATITATATTL